ncbi:MAG: hypoxanthine phosphoribosyltransferase [Candidatus Azobacteroides pseudotrichonymphae]|jgi:hypoxanthine phosphoribosyltransferase|uniref:Hypoxanthine phosphoribosyltransferase n=1 Tax=Azobacteroides pseudotrichonymphae genomovar. CFP2 TaxID=511995 RepID=B6YRA8_AZOPC|nr:phosphoribosyltransferase family protein [Candidatus Azobacteroides pseudotrichonymphae]MDR0530271.1 hypoxanthine phosphoribosyltransferase [Bacteroidales bacterium OttesenSCG-928-I14]BAG83730.1 hypoxanthine phosphoribosyltransferase [Candidatus Azobacteroides pseudotrichonymphae genomovar. CFP2]GMO34919.1 MAG: hypoxanthine phosphoribosyltransferase [Candidatus Azobacteroides pseudotrichonymphae]
MKLIERVLIKDKWFKLLIPEEDLIEGIERVAKQINEDLKGKTPLFIGILNGAFMFASELIGRFNSPCEVTFIRLKSYEGIERGEKMKEIQSLTENIEDRHIVVIEDTIDTGHTINYLLKLLRKKNPASIKIATLLFKPNAIQFNINPVYVVKEISNEFVIGFGADYDEQGRNYRSIYQVVNEK